MTHARHSFTSAGPRCRGDSPFHDDDETAVSPSVRHAVRVNLLSSDVLSCLSSPQKNARVQFIVVAVANSKY